MRILYIKRHAHEIQLSKLIKELVTTMAKHGEMRVRFITETEAGDLAAKQRRGPSRLDRPTSRIGLALAALQQSADESAY